MAWFIPAEGTSPPPGTPPPVSARGAFLSPTQLSPQLSGTEDKAGAEIAPGKSSTPGRVHWKPHGHSTHEGRQRNRRLWKRPQDPSSNLARRAQGRASVPTGAIRSDPAAGSCPPGREAGAEGKLPQRGWGPLPRTIPWGAEASCQVAVGGRLFQTLPEPEFGEVEALIPGLRLPAGARPLSCLSLGSPVRPADQTSLAFSV